MRALVFREFHENQHVTAIEICRKHGLLYKRKGHSIRTYLGQAKAQYDLRTRPYDPLVSIHSRIWACPVVLFENGLTYLAHQNNWSRARNRNRMLSFSCRLGGVHWFPSGKVQVFPKGPSTVGHAKTLFCRAFRFLGDDRLSELCKMDFVEETRHHVFPVGKALPRFDIRDLEKSDGLRILSDGSHPNAVEVIQTMPLWIQNYDRLNREFYENVKKHLELVQILIDQAKRKGFWSRLFGWIQALFKGSGSGV